MLDDDGKAGDYNGGEVSWHFRVSASGCDEANDPNNGHHNTSECCRDCRV